MSVPAASKPSKWRIASPTAAGISLALLSVFIFTFNNAIGKWFIASFPVLEFLLIRAIASIALLTPFYWREGLAPFRAAPLKRLQLLRIALAAFEITAFYWALSYLTLADTLTLWLAAPIYVTALSAVLLREKVGRRLWAAIIVGFAGVVLVMRPTSASLTAPALIGVAGGVAYACGLLLTRRLRGTHDMVLLTGQLAGVLIFGLVAAPFVWVTPSPRDCAIIAGIAVLSTVASLYYIRALKLAPASIIAPYKNTMIIWGVIFGYVFFGEVPDLTKLAGAAIIIGAGLYIFVHEAAWKKTGAATTP
jgi:drug/metabolite transporter (DMT)-like permease